MTDSTNPFTSKPAPRSSVFRFEATRWTKADRIALGGTLVLFISLFLPWFTYNYGVGSVSVDGLWHGWMYLVLILSLAIIAYLVLSAGYSTLPFKLPLSHNQLLLSATALSFVLTLLAFVFKPGGYGFHGIGWGFGSFVGIIAALVAVAPFGWPAIQARRGLA